MHLQKQSYDMIACDGRGPDLLAKEILSSFVFLLGDINKRTKGE